MKDAAGPTRRAKAAPRKSEAGFAALQDENRRLAVQVAELKAALEAREIEVGSLRESQDRFRTLAEASFDGIVILENGVILDANPRFAGMMGYALPEILGKSVLEFIYPEDRDLVWGNISTRREEPYENRLSCKDGSVITVEVRARHFASRGRRLRISAVRDITERKTAEDVLRQAHEILELRVAERTAELARTNELLKEKIAEGERAGLRLAEVVDLNQKIFAASALGISVFRASGENVLANEAAARIVGATVEAVQKQNFLKIPSWKEFGLTEMAEKALSTGREQRGEMHFRSSFGKEVWLEFSFTSFSSGGEPHLLLIMNDVTERIQARQQLTETLDLNQKMIASSTLGIEAFKASGPCVLANEAAARIVGGTIEQIQSHDFRKIDAWQDSGMLACAESALANNREQRAEFHVNSTFGKEVWLDCSFTPFTSGGEPHLLVILNDISQRKRTEAEIEQRNYELMQVRNILSGLATHLDLKEILHFALQGAMELTGLSGGTLCLVNAERQTLSLSAARNTSIEMESALSRQDIKIGECLCGSAAREGEPLILWDNASGSEYATLEAVRAEGIRFHAALPLIANRKTIGVLCLFERSAKQPTRHSLDLVQELCTSVALAIENAQLYERTRRNEARAEALVRTASRLNARLELNAVFKTVCEEAVRALNVPAANFYIFDETQSVFSLVAAYGFADQVNGSSKTMPYGYYQSLSRRYGTAGIIEDLRQFNEMPGVELYLAQGVRSVMTVSVYQGVTLLGLLNVFSVGEPRKFESDEMALLQGLGNQAAQAVTNARLFEQVSAGREHLRALSQRLVEIQEAERRTLALELHDELGQLLSSTKMSLDLLPPLPEESAQEHLVRAKSLVGELVRRVRQMSLELRPSILDDLGLLAALLWLFKNYKAQTGQAVDFEYSGLDRRFSPPLEITVYRIVQEALTNVIRHAGVTQVGVNIWSDNQSLNLQIVDRGKGFDAAEALARHDSSGLSGMRERARLLGGELVVESTPGEGTSLSLRLPFPSQAADGGE